MGTVWAIFTLGKIEPGAKRGDGVIALYSCRADDQACLSNQTDHPLGGWQIVRLPYPGGATLLGLDPRPTPRPDVVTIDDGGHQICFNVTQRTFDGPC